MPRPGKSHKKTDLRKGLTRRIPEAKQRPEATPDELLDPEPFGSPGGVDPRPPAPGQEPVVDNLD